MQKVVTYLYPDVKKASSLKVFQDRTNQIRAFYALYTLQADQSARYLQQIVGQGG